jgi:hypothetical protein
VPDNIIGTSHFDILIILVPLDNFAAILFNTDRYYYEASAKFAVCVVAKPSMNSYTGAEVLKVLKCWESWVSTLIT